VTGAQVARVIRVIDGDTIEVEIEGQTFTVRYIGVDTPETVAPGQPVECFGPQASARNKELVVGRTVELEKDVSETDRYGRLLRYVYVDGRMVNELLVAEGFAQVSTYPPDVKYVDRFLEAQRRAREQALGLWGACATGEAGPTGVAVPPPTRVPGEGAASVVIDPSCSQFNSPGDDNLTATEEYVCFRNTGGAAATMTGWSVNDFGVRHTYVFPPFDLAAGAAMRLRSGCGANTASDLYWCIDGAVWNNAGDVVTLCDAVGNVVASYSYGSPS
jgi:micrococcal nuclease